MSKKMSLKFNICFWAITIPFTPIIILGVILALINPFWFREDFAGWLEQIVHRFSKWRFNKLKPLYYKDNFFDILKDPSSLK
jgi:hypothetical protein